MLICGLLDPSEPLTRFLRYQRSVLRFYGQVEKRQVTLEANHPVLFLPTRDTLVPVRFPNKPQVPLGLVGLLLYPSIFPDRRHASLNAMDLPGMNSLQIRGVNLDRYL